MKPELADAVAEYMAKDVENLLQRQREGEVPGFLSNESVRYGHTFEAWEKFTDGDAVER